jgi:hypothetical protein
MRRLAPELLVTAKTQRWAPEELLRTLIEAVMTARDESNTRTRLRAATFPVTKTLDEFDLSLSSVPRATFDYLASLEWLRAKENTCLIGPPGTGKSHLLVALGHAAVEAGYRVRYFNAAELVETLYRGLADNSVGRVIDTLLRADLVIADEVGFAPSTTPAPSSCSGSWPPPTNGNPSGSVPTGRSNSGAGASPSSPPPPGSSTGSSITATWSSPAANRIACAKRNPAGRNAMRRDLRSLDQNLPRCMVTRAP